MLILSLDTTAKVATCALCENESVLAHFFVNNGNTHTENILPMIDDMMKKCKKTMSDVSLICATNGPGSFTGVRIGAATVKGLAFGRDIPCAEVSTLDALAYNLCAIGDGAILCPVMDARRAQVYNALYELENGKPVRLCEDRAISLDELLLELKERYADKPIYLCGDGYSLTYDRFLGKLEKLAPTPQPLIEASAVSVAILGYKKFLEGSTTDERTFSPTYLRKSQAEREREEKEKNNK